MLKSEKYVITQLPALNDFFRKYLLDISSFLLVVNTVILLVLDSIIWLKLLLITFSIVLVIYSVISKRIILRRITSNIAIVRKSTSTYGIIAYRLNVSERNSKMFDFFCTEAIHFLHRIKGMQLLCYSFDKLRFFIDTIYIFPLPKKVYKEEYIESIDQLILEHLHRFFTYNEIIQGDIDKHLYMKSIICRFSSEFMQRTLTRVNLNNIIEKLSLENRRFSLFFGFFPYKMMVNAFFFVALEYTFKKRKDEANDFKMSDFMRIYGDNIKLCISSPIEIILTNSTVQLSNRKVINILKSFVPEAYIDKFREFIETEEREKRVESLFREIIDESAGEKILLNAFSKFNNVELNKSVFIHGKKLTITVDTPFFSLISFSGERRQKILELIPLLIEYVTITNKQFLIIVTNEANKNFLRNVDFSDTLKMKLKIFSFNDLELLMNEVKDLLT